MTFSTLAQRILIVDDDPEIVRLLSAYLQKANYVVSIAYDGKTALALIRSERPALVLLDLMLPDLDGWDITRTIRADNRIAALPIIMLTARIEDTDKIIGLELGADDYITKPFNPREVVARVRAMLRRSAIAASVTDGSTDSTSLECGPIRLDSAQHTVTISDRLVDLTPTEYDLLRTFMENPGYVFTRASLIEHSLGYDYESLERTLDTHIKNLRRKIEPDPRNPTYIQTVYGVGYRLEKA